VSKRFGYSPRPHCSDRFPHRSDFPTGGSHTHFKPRHLDGPHFSHPGSRPTRPNGEVQRTMKTSSDRVGFLRFISLAPALSHRHLLVLCR
jgi:hypothetical protein